MTTIRWLHLTDFHQGMTGQAWLWPNMRAQLFNDLAKLQKKVGGPWDLVFFTGDLTQTGSAAEFKTFEQTLALIWKCFQDLGSRPRLLAVPGNHDLVRPNPKKGTVKAFAQWKEDADIRSELWSGTPNEYRELLEEAFNSYTQWQKESAFHEHDIQTGLLPGDFSFTLEKEGVKLGVAGLNSAFLQLTNGDYIGRLALDPRQLHAVCKKDTSDWVAQHDATILLTHHPQDWLNESAQAAFNGEILARDNFTLHCFGHMHTVGAESRRRGGGPKRLSMQGSSLFGLESWGEGEQLVRQHGYVAGQIEFKETELRLSFWPRVASKKEGGYLTLGPDSSQDLEDELWFETLQRTRSKSQHPSSAGSSAQRDLRSAVNEETNRPQFKRPSLSAGDYLRLHERAKSAITRLSDLGGGLGWHSFTKLSAELMEILQQEPYRVVITGRSRAGKSTLLNAMIGRDICPVKRTLTTAVPIVISPNEEEFLTIDFGRGNCTRIDGPVTKEMIAPYADQKNNQDNKKGVREIRVELADEVLNLGVRYVDIPGFDDASDHILTATEEAIQQAHALVLVMDVSTFANGGFSIDKPTIEVLQKAKERGCPAFVVCNKSERLLFDERDALMVEIRSTLEKYDVWTNLCDLPFLLSAQAASVAREGKTPIPSEYELFHDALWKSLWNTETIGLRRLFRVFKQLQLAREKLDVLIAARRAKEPDRVRLQTALTRCVNRWTEIHNGCEAVVKDALLYEQELCKSTAAMFRAEIKAWVAALPAERELPKNSDAVNALHEMIVPHWRDIATNLEKKLTEGLSPLEQSMSKILTELTAVVGSSHDEQTAKLLTELSGWADQVVKLDTEYSDFSIKALVGTFAISLTALFVSPIAAAVSAVAGIGALSVTAWIKNRAENREELEAKLAQAFDEQWSKFDKHLRQQISSLGRSLTKKTRDSMNPFFEDMKKQIDTIRDVSADELKLFDKMNQEIQGALSFLHEILK